MGQLLALPTGQVRAVGFTGTRQGMTEAQRRRVRWLLGRLRAGGAVEFHHGAARGADSQAEDLATSLGYVIVRHPAAKGRELARNHIIVGESDGLLATPATRVEQLRSGTWATVRYGRKADVPTIVVAPDAAPPPEGVDG